MDRHSIITLPNDVLRQKSQKVAIFDDAVAQLCQDMISASLNWETYREHEFCVGLAAVQVAILKKIVVLRENLEDKSDTRFVSLINPKIIKVSGTPELDYEGCLSVKDIYGLVPRYPKVKVKAFDPSGNELRLTLTGFSARLMQHEIDHTNGVVFIDHIKDDADAFFKIKDDGTIVQLDYEKEIKNAHELW